MTDRIKTERLVLRAARVGDARDMAAGLGDFEVSKWLARVPHPFGPDDVRITGDDGRSTWPDFAVIALADRVIGGIRTGPRMGFWLARPHWGRGYMFEAAGAALARHFRVSPDSDVTAGVFHGNAASERLLGRLGFVRDGRARTAFCAARAAELPISDYRLTRSAWEARA